MLTDNDLAAYFRVTITEQYKFRSGSDEKIPPHYQINPLGSQTPDDSEQSSLAERIRRVIEFDLERELLAVFKLPVRAKIEKEYTGSWEIIFSVAFLYGSYQAIAQLRDFVAGIDLIKEMTGRLIRRAVPRKVFDDYYDASVEEILVPWAAGSRGAFGVNYGHFRDDGHIEKRGGWRRTPSGAFVSDLLRGFPSEPPHRAAPINAMWRLSQIFAIVALAQMFVLGALCFALWTLLSHRGI